MATFRNIKLIEDMIIIGPDFRCGISQHAIKYSKMLNCDYFDCKTVLNYQLPTSDAGLWFHVPNYRFDKYNIDGFRQEIRSKVKHLILYTVCETETVDEAYRTLFEGFTDIAVPSEFCKRVFCAQFPEYNFHVIFAHIPLPKNKIQFKKEVYTFYHIGNVLDPRKNFQKVIDAFISLAIPQTRLLIKNTGPFDVSNFTHNSIKVINGFFSEEQMDDLHEEGDCYVSFSFSEGVGLGAVEAAMRDKVVIIPSYGGGAEYIKTEYIISCEKGKVGFDDFLFAKDMIWGQPDYEQLKAFMKDAAETDKRFCDHQYTREKVKKETVLQQFNELIRIP